MTNESDTYCGKCIKADVCGMEGVYDPAMTYCAYRVEERPQKVVSNKTSICPLIYDPCIGEDCICFDWKEYPNGNDVDLYGYCKHLCVYTGHEKEGEK